MPLTDVAIRKAAPREKPYRLADSGGMYLEVSPTGGKYWRLKYRFLGKEKRLALGVYPDVSLAAAREKRDDARKKLAAGVDPSEAKKADKRAARLAATNSFEAVALGWMDELKPYVTTGLMAKTKRTAQMSYRRHCSATRCSNVESRCPQFWRSDTSSAGGGLLPRRAISPRFSASSAHSSARGPVPLFK